MRWTQVSLTGDPMRLTGHRGVLWRGSDNLLVFGGYADAVQNEAYIVDLGSGTVRRLNWNGSPPPTLHHHTMVYDSTNDRAVIFGGVNENMGGSQLTNETYFLTRDGGRVQSEPVQLAADSPRPGIRAYHTAVFLENDPANPGIPVMMVYGGLNVNTGIYGDVWALSLGPSPHRWKEVGNLGSGVGSRFGHAAVISELQGTPRMFVYGGERPGNTNIGDMGSCAFASGAANWLYHGERSQNGLMTARSGVALVSLEDGGRSWLYALCGFRHRSDYLNEIWVCDLGGAQPQEWRPEAPSGTKPAGRKDALGVVYDGQIYLHGGRGYSGVHGDLWVLES
jgi:hypothetical protein